MLRLLSFLLLMLLRFLAVLSLVLWGISRVALPWYVQPITEEMSAFASTAHDGITIGIIENKQTAATYGTTRTKPGIHDSIGRSIVSLRYFVVKANSQPTAYSVGVSYLLALFSSILFYGVVRHFTRQRRRRRKLSI